MPIYWTKKSVPELAGLSRQQRDEVWKATQWKFLHDWKGWVAMVLTASMALVAIELTDLIPSRAWEWPVGGVIMGVIFMIGGQVRIQLNRPHRRAYLDSSRSKEDA